ARRRAGEIVVRHVAPPNRATSCRTPTSNCAAPSRLRGRKAPKDGQQPCFTPKERCLLSQSLMAAIVRLSRSWEDLGCHRPLFTMSYRCHLHKKTETAPP